MVVGIPNQEEAILRCVAAGAAGLVTREESLNELSRALHEVLESGYRLPAYALAPLLDRLVALGAPALPGGSVEMRRLSAREIEVVSHMARGATNKEIALQLSVEVQTVKNCVSRILRKLAVHSRYDAARLWASRAPTEPYSHRPIGVDTHDARQPSRPGTPA